MIRYYCGKCKAGSETRACSKCGKNLPANTEYNEWSVYHVPVADGALWRFAFLTLLAAAVLLFAIVFGGEALLSGTDKAMALFDSRLAPVIVAIIPVGLLVLFIGLNIQGRETIYYKMNYVGVRLETWHPASRIKSWARLQDANMESAFVDPEGLKIVRGQVRHILWQDVQVVRYSPTRGAILLYHTAHCAPFTLRLPPEEYETASAMVQKYCKGK